MTEQIDPYSLDSLLLRKEPDRVSENDIAELRRISSLDVDTFTEADVREEIINPILKILGYRKGNDYSVDREKHIRFVGKKSRYIDYNLTLWNEGFWLIEAKKPYLSDERFGYKEASQAFEYAAHPEIRAALVVLCDGIKLEVFDREENVEEPILSMRISEVLDRFYELSQILGPLQVWFFYRRRIIRELDRAFEKESNLTRATEFCKMIDARLDQKRSLIMENLRKLKIFDNDNSIEVIKEADYKDIINSYYFIEHTMSRTNVMNNQLLSVAQHLSLFKVFSEIFPEKPRDANNLYYMYALDFLLKLEKRENYIEWVPSWLRSSEGRENVSDVIRNFLSVSLTYFEQDAAQRTILLASDAYRRIFKLIAIAIPIGRRTASLEHLITRVLEPEFSLEQILSSPGRNMIFGWERQAFLSTKSFVREFRDEKKNFRSSMAKRRLFELLSIEATLLESNKDYKDLVTENNCGEIYPTEHVSVSFDYLGHAICCIIAENEVWKSYVLNNHKKEVESIAILGSPSARILIDQDIDCVSSQRDKREIAISRFFYGKEDIYDRLNMGYHAR